MGDKGGRQEGRKRWGEGEADRVGDREGERGRGRGREGGREIEGESLAIFHNRCTIGVVQTSYSCSHLFVQYI